MNIENNSFESLDLVKNADQDGGERKKNIFKKSTEKEPLISIITVVLNNEKYLQESIDSLKKQQYKNFEFIVIFLNKLFLLIQILMVVVLVLFIFIIMKTRLDFILMMLMIKIMI